MESRYVSSLARSALACLLLSLPLAAAADPVDQGRALYQNGRTGANATAGIGEPPTTVPVTLFPCRSCHGSDARGSREGGVSAPDIRWSQLTKPYQLRSGAGRERPPYDAGTLARAITLGIDAAGNRLAPTMPRYRLSADEVDALTAYLRTIDRPAVSGVDADTLRIGLLTEHPATPAVAKTTVAGFFAQLNRDGGLYKRRLQLITGDAQRLADADLLAIIAHDASGAADLARRQPPGARDTRPVITVFGPTTTHDGDNAVAFALYPGSAQRTQTLVAFAEQEWRIAPTAVTRYSSPFNPNPEAAAVLVTRVDELDAALSGLHPATTLLVACPLTTEQASRLRQHRGLVLLTRTPAAEDLHRRGQQAYLRLVRAQPLPTQHLQQQLWYLAAAELLTAALADSGRTLTTETLTARLAQRFRQSGGWGTALNFGRPHRHERVDVHTLTP